MSDCGSSLVKLKNRRCLIGQDYTTDAYRTVETVDSRQFVKASRLHVLQPASICDLAVSTHCILRNCIDFDYDHKYFGACQWKNYFI